MHLAAVDIRIDSAS